MEHTVISGFHHIGLKCADIKKSIAMYQALGMKEVMRWGEDSGRVVMLDLGDGGRLEMFADGSDEFSPNGKWIHFALKVTDVEAVYRQALEIGFTSRMEPTILPLSTKPEPTPVHIAFVYGPDGEQIEFFKEA